MNPCSTAATQYLLGKPNVKEANSTGGGGG